MLDINFDAGPLEGIIAGNSALEPISEDGRSFKFDAAFGNGAWNGYDIESGFQVSILKGTILKHTNFHKQVYEPSGFFDLIFCDAPSLEQENSKSGLTVFGVDVNKSAIFSNAKTEVTYRFPVDVEFNWVVMRFFNGYLDRYASEDKDYLKKLVNTNKPFLIHEYIDMDMELVLNRLIDANNAEVFRQQKIRALAMHAATFFFERLRAGKRQLARNRIRQTDYERSFKVREDLITDLGNPPTISELAEKHGISTSKLKTLFKQVFGKTIYQYYQEHRMEKARAMLAKEDLNVSEVGYRVGYSNLSHFSEAFKKQYGRLPKQYMQETRSKKGAAQDRWMN